MPRTGRPGLTHREKRELWYRWKAGQTLSEIGRALGKHAGSVHGVLGFVCIKVPNPPQKFEPIFVLKTLFTRSLEVDF